MPFNSLTYFLFLPVVWLIHHVAGERARWMVLLAASLAFYAALNVPYLLMVLALVAVTTYAFGLWLEQAEHPGTKRVLLWGGVVANVLILIGMKYLPFLSENLQALSALFSFDTEIKPVKAFVAIGVSYYVFQAISYLFDIYLEIEKAERHFGHFALYLAFFPKLMQGPIERAGDLLPQFKGCYEFNYDNMRFGLFLFTWGLFKKVVVADRLGLCVDSVYSDVHAFTGLPLLLATYAYAFQLYFDFSGYTDMAMGSARLFNINLTQNFNSPYLATSVADFWRRWHMSFSRWIFNYLFKPLHKMLLDRLDQQQLHWRFSANLATALALLVTFLVSGLWHGASWGFVVWGGMHGLYMGCSIFWKPFQKKLHKALGIEKTRLLKAWQVFVTFNLVSLALVCFRANNLQDAGYVVTNLFSGSLSEGGLSVVNLLTGSRLNLYNSLMLIVALNAMIFVVLAKDRFPVFRQQTWFRWGVYLILTIWVLLFQSEGSADFLYQRF